MEKSHRSGWIKSHRQILDWEWIGDSQTYHLFGVMALLANHKDGNWQGKEIKKGSFITSIGSLSKLTNISTMSIRTILQRLEKSGEINKQTTNKYTIITICKYSDYQSNENEDNIELANNYQTTSKQLATNKNVKNNKNEKKSVSHGETDSQYSFTEIKTQLLEQDLDIELFWSELQKVYKPENDKGLFNSKAVKKQKSIIKEFDKESREKILEWFRKYKDQLKIGNPWISNFFTDKKTIEEVANYFRSIKDIKETTKDNKVNKYGIKQVRNFDDYELPNKKQV